MVIKTIKKDNYNLHIIKNTNFKTVLIKTVFWNKIKENEITLRNMLIDNLLISSKNYKTTKEMSIKKEDLYGTSISGYTFRKGSYILSEINMSVIEDKYCEKGLFNDAIKFYFDVLNNPNVTNGCFDKDSFNITYESLKASIMQTNENPRSFAFREYRKLLGNDIYTYPIEGKLEDLEKITTSNLYDYYKKFTSSNNVDIFIIGNVSSSIEKEIDSLYKFNTKNNKISDICISYKKDFSEDIIKTKYNQSTLIMGCSTNDLTEHEKKYESLIFNIIFGNSPNSKLFLNVREKNSYAYTISSSFSRIDGLFLISAGISRKNYENTKIQINKELLDMKKGNFSLKDIKDAKEVILGVLNEINDYQNSIINHYFSYIYLNDDSIEVQKKELLKITKEDIIKLANKINIDTILLIEEDENGTNTN